MRTMTRLSAVLSVAALILALSVATASAQDSTDDEFYPPSATDDQDTDTGVLGEVITPAQDTEGDTDDDLAFTGRTVGSAVGVATLAVVVGGVLIVLARRREGLPT